MDNEAKRRRQVRQLLIERVYEPPQVLVEINARAMCDPKVRSVVAENGERWRRFLMQIVKEGIQKREFNSPLGPETAVDAIVAIVRGLSITYARPLRQLRVAGSKVGPQWFDALAHTCNSYL